MSLVEGSGGRVLGLSVCDMILQINMRKIFCLLLYLPESWLSHWLNLKAKNKDTTVGEKCKDW